MASSRTARGPAIGSGLRRASGLQQVRAAQRRIVAQDTAVQLAQLRAGLDGELGDQDVAQLPVDAQRVGLPSGPVQR